MLGISGKKCFSAYLSVSVLLFENLRFSSQLSFYAYVLIYTISFCLMHEVFWPQLNFLKIFRDIDVECNRILHVAGGEHTGIVINKLIDGKPSLLNFFCY